MNGQQFPINPKWQRDFDIATVKFQNLFTQLQKSWEKPPAPQQSQQQPAQEQPPTPPPQGY